MKPFLKWAGNKYKIIHKIRKILPHGRRLIEPFAGSGAVFLNTEFQNYLLADNNADLIHLYKTLQEEGDGFIDYAEELFASRYNTERAFYDLRNEFNDTDDLRRKSALFLYLNRHAYNGLCRYNRQGRFNVPFGRYKKPYFPRKEMQEFYRRALRARFEPWTFARSMNQAKAGDVVYCDPPYVPLSDSASFTSYTAGGFDLTQQTKLAVAAHNLTAKGVTVIISNHDNAQLRKIYKHAHPAVKIRKLSVQRFISCDGSNRGKAAEILAIFSPVKTRVRHTKKSK